MNYGEIQMEHLEIGDYVLGNEQTYTKVVGWLHKQTGHNNSGWNEIVYTNGNMNKTLIVSWRHHVRLASGAYLEAQDIKVGSQLMGGDGTPREVIDIVYLDGVQGSYSPMTESGTIVVDGIQCSIYAYGVQYEWFMHMMTWPWRSGWLKVPIDSDIYSSAAIPGMIARTYMKLVSNA